VFILYSVCWLVMFRCVVLYFFLQNSVTCYLSSCKSGYFKATAVVLLRGDELLYKTFVP